MNVTPHIRAGALLLAVTLPATVAAAALAAAGPGALTTRAAATPQADTLRFVVAPEGNEARYMIREQLARISFPSDAVGRTTNVTGQLVLDERGAVVGAQSRFVIDLASITSDQDRRDNYVRRNTLTTAEYPSATFAPTAVRGLTWPLPQRSELTFQLIGELTVRDVTRPVTWQVTATIANGVISGLAATRLTFEQFSLQKPRVASVLSVEDEIRLEYEFRLVPETRATP
jgi:polyisoprenoid-binding protein YceI